MIMKMRKTIPLPWRKNRMAFEEDFPEWFKEKYKVELSVTFERDRYWIELGDVKKLLDEQKQKVKEAIDRIEYTFKGKMFEQGVNSYVFYLKKELGLE